MNQERFTKLVDNTVAELRRLLVAKGGEYAGSEDRLANFKRGAGLTGATPLQVALIYLSKHYDAVATYVRDDAAGVTRDRSEPIDGRLDDLMNYCLLTKALVEERTEERHNANVVATTATLGKPNRRDRSKRPQPAPRLTVEERRQRGQNL